MLTPFPWLLDLSFFAPTLLRLAVGALSLYVAYATWKDARPETKSGLGWASVAANAILGAMLIAGYYTQWAALLALIFRLASFIMPQKYRALVPLAPGVRLLAAVILLSLLLTGAGALALDVRL